MSPAARVQAMQKPQQTRIGMYLYFGLTKNETAGAGAGATRSHTILPGAGAGAGATKSQVAPHPWYLRRVHIPVIGHTHITENNW